MMHTKSLPVEDGLAPGAAREVAPGRAPLTWLERWLMPWSRLRARARDGGPPQWPLPWR